MSKLTVYTAQGETAGAYEFPDRLLVRNRGEQAVHDAVVAHQAALRAGTADTKGRGRVAGSGRKPWKQKGTGRARVGSVRSPIWRGGGVVFGPHPRSYAQKINRKTAQLAFRRALSDKIAAGEVVVVEGLSVNEPKTRALAGLLKKLDVRRGLLVVDKQDRALGLAARNLPGVEVVTAAEASTYQVLRAPRLVVSRPAVETLEKRMQPASGGAA